MFSINEEIFELTESKNRDKHRCMNGKYVDFYSIDCKNDLLSRIDDAIYLRDCAGSRTDERIHYNGLLSVLRRKLRDIDRELTMIQMETKRKNMQESLSQPNKSLNRRKIDSDQRILKMAGLF